MPWVGGWVTSMGAASASESTGHEGGGPQAVNNETRSEAACPAGGWQGLRWTGQGGVRSSSTGPARREHEKKGRAPTLHSYCWRLCSAMGHGQGIVWPYGQDSAALAPGQLVAVRLGLLVAVLSQLY
jgi:hypothetical protein